MNSIQRLLNWLWRRREQKREEEEKKTEAKLSKQRAFDNIKQAVAIIESGNVTADQLDDATLCARSMTINLNKKKETDQLKKKEAV